jgi:hypothetical protein
VGDHSAMHWEDGACVWWVALRLRTLPGLGRPRSKDLALSGAVFVGPESGPLVPELLEDLAEEPFYSIPNPGLLSLEVARHVERPGLVLCDPRCDV